MLWTIDTQIYNSYICLSWQYFEISFTTTQYRRHKVVLICTMSHSRNWILNWRGSSSLFLCKILGPTSEILISFQSGTPSWRCPGLPTNPVALISHQIKSISPGWKYFLEGWKISPVRKKLDLINCKVSPWWGRTSRAGAWSELSAGTYSTSPSPEGGKI